ncbi:MAG: hypothetical protein ACAI37_10215, partial [Chthoniobacter sp.]
LAPLADLTELITLSLEGCTSIENLAPLAGLTHLRWLSLPNCSGIRDLAPLTGLTQLLTLDISGCSSLSAEAVAMVSQGLPKVRIHSSEGNSLGNNLA